MNQFVALWIFSGFILQSQAVLGCFCITPDDSVARADIIFTGVAHLDSYYYEESNCYYCLEGLVIFEVNEILKGKDHYGLEASRKFAILQEGSNCSFYFEQDSAYTVYANFVQDPVFQSNFPFLTTGQCRGTNQLRIGELKNYDVSTQNDSQLSGKATTSSYKFWRTWFWLSLCVNVLLMLLVASSKFRK